MSGTFLCPNSCGFAKVVAIEVAREVGSLTKKESKESETKYHARLKQEQYNQYTKDFSEVAKEKFRIDFASFNKKLPNLREKFTKWSFRKKDEKEKFIKTFSREQWRNLPVARKIEHSLANCKACAVRHATEQAYFSGQEKSIALKGKAKANPVFAAEDECKKLRSAVPTVKPLLKDIKNTAKAVYGKVAQTFEQTFNKSFAETLSKIPELNLQHKDKSERRKERRKQYSQSKGNSQKQMEDTAFVW